MEQVLRRPLLLMKPTRGRALPGNLPVEVPPDRIGAPLARRMPVQFEALDLSDAEALSDLLEVTASVFTGLAERRTLGECWRDEDYPVSVTTKELSLQVVPLPVSLP